MTSSGWPPPAESKRDWHKRELLIGGRREWVKVREVQLWSRAVLINEAFDVYCPGCLAFQSVRDLGSPANRCPVGIVRNPGVIRRFDSGDPAQDGPDESGPRRFRNLMQGSW